MIRAIGICLLLLKILGIVLLALLLLLVIALLAVLFVPVRYRASAENIRTENAGMMENMRVQADISWLFHFISLSIRYGPDGVTGKIRAAGIDIQKMLARRSKRGQKEEKRKAEKNTLLKQADSGQASAAETEKTEPAPQAQSIQAHPDTTEDTLPVSHMSGSQKKARRKKKKKGSVPKLKKFRGFQLKKEKRKKSGAPPHAADGKKKKISDLKEKAGRFHKEFTDASNRSAIRYIWKEICRLLCHYKPRKLKAEVAFSLADPALTGEVIGVISLLPLVYRYPCSIVPDFMSDKLYIEGTIMVEGKITVFISVISLLQLFRAKECRKLFRKLLGRKK